MNSEMICSKSSTDSTRNGTRWRTPLMRTCGGWPDTRCRSEPPWLTAISRKAWTRVDTSHSSCQARLGVQAQQIGLRHVQQELLLVHRLEVGLVRIDVPRPNQIQQRGVHE